VVSQLFGHIPAKTFVLEVYAANDTGMAGLDATADRVDFFFPFSDWKSWEESGQFQADPEVVKRLHKRGASPKGENPDMVSSLLRLLRGIAPAATAA
jgi:hypothetical protein